ncbi:MAG TPA: hypothetical protein VFB82_03625 [Blastocatellia bacterium]|jgi:hypothetical protein|nr:hypothetical protein [Blastocatellia bacterium]
MFKSRIPLFRIAVSALIALALGMPAAAHHLVLRFNLEEMTATADRVFVGRCTTVEETREMIAQGMMAVTRYTFEVERVIKGRVPKTLTFRQEGHRARIATGKGKEMVAHGRVVSPDTFHGMSEYEVGDRVVLFLIPDYLGGKVTYPVGLYQGAFRVSDMPSGQRLVRNSINNLGLFTAPYNGWKLKAADAHVVFPDRDNAIGDVSALGVDGAALVRKRGSLPLEDFLKVVERIVAAHGGSKGALLQ